MRGERTLWCSLSVKQLATPKEKLGKDVDARMMEGKMGEKVWISLILECLPQWRTGADCVISGVARDSIPGNRALSLRRATKSKGRRRLKGSIISR